MSLKRCCNVFAMKKARLSRRKGGSFRGPLSDLSGLLGRPPERARRPNLSENSVAAYERTWRVLLAWTAPTSLDPRHASHTPHRFLDSFQITDGILAFAEAAAMYGRVCS